MRKRMISTMIFCCIIGLAAIAIVYNRYWNISETTKNKTIGSFEYEYKVQGGGTWITKITPKSDQDISVLEIPSRLGGRRVVKLGGEGDKFRIDDAPKKEYENLFGEDYSEESTRDNTIIAPENVYDLVGKIKEIRLPESLKWISLSAFKYVQDEKTINIPEKVKTKLENTSLTDVKWRKVSLSARNREYKVTNGCLCSKDGKTLYGIIEAHKTITIPEGIETISQKGNYSGPDVIKIPASVTEIEKDSTCYVLNTTNPVKILISENNKRFAVKDGSVYDKIAEKLIAGDIKNGVLKIPDTVRTVEYPGFLGNIETLQKVVVAESVTAIHYFDRDANYGNFDLTLVFEGRIPPKIEDWYLLCDSKVYIPKGCEEIYRKEWEEELRKCGYSCSYEEMDHF